MTDPDPNILKSAAAYLVELARSSKGGRYRKSAKIEALRECKDEILEAHRSGISIHRIAQIFRERNVDISTQHLMRAIRLFIAEEERSGGKSSGAQERHPGPVVAEEKQQTSVKYQVPEPSSTLVREEFVKQLRLARYLAGASLGRPREIEKAGEKAPSITKPKPRAKAQSGNKKGVEAELARERRRANQAGRQKGSSSGRGDYRRAAKLDRRREKGPIGFSGLDDATIIKLKINGGGSTKRFTLCLYRRKTPSVPTPHSYIRATRHAVMPSHSAQAISHC